MYVKLDIWTVIAKQQRKLNAIQKMWKKRLIKRSPLTALFVVYYRVSNAILKTALKTKIKAEALLWRILYKQEEKIQ